jgi:hypothetical protein
MTKANAIAAIRRIGNNKQKQKDFIAGCITTRQTDRATRKAYMRVNIMQESFRRMFPTRLLTPADMDAMDTFSWLPTPTMKWKFDEYVAGIQLRAIVNDRQSVHTSIIVKKTTEVIEKILAIPVPLPCMWNAEFASQTLGEIITQIPFQSDDCAWFVDKYLKYSNRDCSFMPTTGGLYGKMIDGIWQFICNSPHKTDLMYILRSEIHDSVGMCADGGISRLCNILSGYMDGLNFDTESPVEKVGRLLSQVVVMYANGSMEVMIESAKHILRECEIPQSEWEPWLETVRESK